jgi:hypothetical protein
MPIANHILRGATLGLLCTTIAIVAGVGCKPSTEPRAAEGKVIPKGRILKNGLPLKISESSQANVPPGDPGLQITFIKLGGADAGTEHVARIIPEPPGSFDLIGAEGKGIPPGRYRVAVALAPFGGKDELKNKYSRENSKIEIEIKAGEDVVIDLANFP